MPLLDRNMKTLLFAITFLTLGCHGHLNINEQAVVRKNVVNKNLADTPVKSLMMRPNYKVEKGGLTGMTRKLYVNYAAIGCTCAQWIPIKQKTDTVDAPDLLYLERSNSTLMNADSLFDGLHLPIHLALTGQYYKNKGYPKNYTPAKGNPEPAKVFHYSTIRILKFGK